MRVPADRDWSAWQLYARFQRVVPLLYELDDSLAPLTPGGRYLDPQAAATAAAAVANQGR